MKHIAVLAILAGTSAGPLLAQSAPLRVESNLEAYAARDAAVELTFSRAPVRPAERIAVFIDRTDVTGLFRSTANGLAYERGMVLLPAGEHELVVYRVDGTTGAWEELLREPFRTPGRFGFHAGSVDPSMTAAWATRPASSTTAEQAPSNVDLQFRLSSEHVRRNLTLSSRMALAGASRREKALRFRQDGENAPLVDLASYRLDAANGPVSLSVGHLESGTQRHLVNDFAARGASMRLRPSTRFDLTLAMQNGSNEAGWSNPFGVQESDHRVVTGSLGVEAFATPGALRLEVTGMQGSVLPRAAFNQGVINDAEESRGVALRVTSSLLERRVRLDAGYATSTFDNPSDPLLSQGAALVEVAEETAGARYLEATVDAIRNLRLGATRNARLTLGVRHERVDPLYRSLGSYAQADRQNDVVDVSADIAGLGVQGSLARSRNNLGDIASILTTRTERAQLGIGVPFARIIGVRTDWLPTLRLRHDRTHQRGDGVPVNGGFDASQVPDQVSLNRSASLDWRVGTLTLGLEWNRSEQDNRQPGRETADLNVTRRGVDIGLAPGRRVQLRADVALESSHNVQRDETDETLRLGGQLDWQLFDRSSLGIRYSDTATDDALAIRSALDRRFDVQWSSVLPWLARVQGRYFVRYSHNRIESLDASFDRDDRRTLWWIDLGVDFTFFQEAGS